MDAKKLFIETLVGQVRALDQFGTWTGKSNEELIVEKYIRTKEDLKKFQYSYLTFQLKLFIYFYTYHKFLVHL